MGDQINIRQIMACLPHRYPLILVDRILSITPGESIIALKNVTINEPFFQGHFPDNPIMPGVLVLEAMGQAGGILAHESIPDAHRGAAFYFMGIDGARFRKPVTPGDQLILEMRLLRRRSRAVKMSGVAKVNDAVAAQAELMATIGEKP